MFFKRYLCKIFPVIAIQLILWLSLVECEVIVNKIQSKANESSYQFLKATPTPKLLKTTTSIVSDKENATLINNIIPTTIDDDRDGRAQKGKEMEDFEESDYVYESKEPQASTCILNKPEYYMSWWVNEDGSLKLARPMRGQTQQSGYLDLSLTIQTENSILEQVTRLRTSNPNDIIMFMSLAQNGLLRVPTDALEMTNVTLQYLSLAGNNFNILFAPNVNTSFYNWSTFPLMLTLKELDLRNCSIDSLDEDIFRNLPQLEHLFMAHNLFKRVASSAFMYLSKLTHLDISYNNYYRESIEPNIINDGLFLPEYAFQNLSELFFLDFSHTKLLTESVKAFSSLGAKMEQLSLCYTDISAIAPSMFQHTNMKVLDLSGNQDLSKTLHHSAFYGLEDRLEVLVFGESNLKHLRYFKNLAKLRMMDLRNNYIVDVNSSFFRRLPNLEIIDLQHNLIEIWKVRVFDKNHKLMILNLRSNKINYLSPEMIEDFADVTFLAIGNNNFICTCILREFIDKAIRNAQDFHCPGLEDSAVTVQPMERFKRSVPYAYRRFDKETYYNVISREYNTCFSQVNRSYRNLKRYRQYRNRPNKDTDKFVEFRRNNRRRYKLVDRIVSLAKSGTINPTSEEIIEIPTTTEMPSKCNDLIPELTPEQIDTYMIEMRMINFSFQLMDFADNDYRCIDPETNNEYRFGDVVACMVKRAEIPVNPPKNPPMDTTTEEARTVPPVEGPRTDFVRDQLQIGIYMLLGAMLLMTLATIIFFKKKKIKYFLILFRNFLILACTSEPDSDKNLLVQKEEKRKHNLKTQKMDDSFTYDVFVSYSDKDRSWVLDELLPNIEKRSTINVCLHERDFQVGLSILENIITCMDQSRCLLLLVSDSFLSSHWCQFEMHLAHHRLLETRREELILVMMDGEIPKSKRPKTLNYLMKTKTYIVWPTKGDKAAKKNFWVRLKKAIISNNWDQVTEKKPPKAPRPSIS